MDIKTLPNRNKQEELIKVATPRQLKRDLRAAAASRNISLSALVRIALTEYIKNKN